MKPNNKHTPWTPADLDRLAELVNSGRTAKQIAEQIGRTVGAINRRCYALKLTIAASRSHRSWSREEDDTLTEMTADGASSKRIAARLVRSIASVDSRKRDLGLQKPTARPAAVENAVRYVPRDARLDLWNLWEAANRRLIQRKADQ